MRRISIVLLLAFMLGVRPGLAFASDDTALKLANVSASNTGFVRVANHAEFSLQTFTLEAWVQRVGDGYGFTTDPSGAGIIAKPREGMSGSNIASWHLHWTNAGQIHFNLTHTVGSSGVYLLSSAVATPLARHHVAVTFDGATIKLYIDGVLSGSAPWSLGTVYYGADDVLIGADNFSFGYFRRFDGHIDDVRVWDYARTAEQITGSMNCRLAGSEPGLVAYWTFDDSNLSDLTGHGHGGLAQGTAGAVTYASLSPLGSCTAGVEGLVPGAEFSMKVFPQPAGERVTLSFELPRPGRVTVDLIDVAGRGLGVWESRHYAAGPHQIAGDVTALLSRSAGSGMVFVRLRFEKQTAVRPLIVLQ